MGHANVSNLSELFINLLYAKGRVSIADAITMAVKRKQKVHASEADCDDRGTFTIGFNDVVSHLSHQTGKGYSFTGKWTGPWIEPEFNRAIFSLNVRKLPETERVTELLRQCCELWVGPGRRAFGNLVSNRDDETLFGVCADAIQDDLGDEDWARRVRHFPRQYRAWRMHELEKWDHFDEEENWKAFDTLKWVFCDGWRKRYREIPRLSNVSH